MKTQKMSAAVTITTAILLLAGVAAASTPIGGSALTPRILYGSGDRRGWDVAALDVARHVGYLSKLEKDVILELNMVRSDPGKYSDMYIYPLIKYYRGNMRTLDANTALKTKEGPSAVRECHNDLKLAAAAPPLLPSLSLSQAAKDHVINTGPVGITGHIGFDGSTLDRRISRHGVWRSGISENIAYGHNTARDIVIALLIDDGVPDRGHRKNILIKNWTYVGVAAGYHAKYKYMCVQNFAEKITDLDPEEKTAPPAVNPAEGAVLIDRTKTKTVSLSLNDINVHTGTLIVYNIFGKPIKHLPVSGSNVIWDLTDVRGRRITAGIYVIAGTVTNQLGEEHYTKFKVEIR